MEKAHVVSSQPYLDQLIDLASHTAAGVGAGILVAKVFVPFGMKNGTILGATIGATTGLIQIGINALGFEETPFNKCLIAAATLATVYFGALHPSAAPLLGRLSLELTKDAMMKFCVVNLIFETVLSGIKHYVTMIPTVEEQVGKVSKETLEDAFKDWLTKTTAKDGKDAEIPIALQPSYLKRFEKEELFKNAIQAIKTLEDVENAPEHVLDYIFNTNATVEEKVVQAKIEKRITDLKQPRDQKAVESMSKEQVHYAFLHYVTFTEGIDKDVKAALDAKIEIAHVQKPSDKETAAAMTRDQLVFAYANYAKYTKNIDKDVKDALDAAMLKENVVTLAKPVNKDEVNNLENVEVRFIHTQHDILFGHKPKGADADTIEQLNVRYATLDLPEQKIPSPKSPRFTKASTTVQKTSGFGYESKGADADNTEQLNVRYATLDLPEQKTPSPKPPRFTEALTTVQKISDVCTKTVFPLIQNHKKAFVASFTGMAVSYGIVKVFEAATGIDIPIL